MQTIADVQKFRHKAREGADAPCFGGLWSLTRHPNYLGEIGFQLGVLGAGLSGCTNIAAIWLGFRVRAGANPNPYPNLNPNLG